MGANYCRTLHILCKANKLLKSIECKTLGAQISQSIKVNVDGTQIMICVTKLFYFNLLIHTMRDFDIDGLCPLLWIVLATESYPKPRPSVYPYPTSVKSHWLGDKCPCEPYHPVIVNSFLIIGLKMIQN